MPCVKRESELTISSLPSPAAAAAPCHATADHTHSRALRAAAAPLQRGWRRSFFDAPLLTSRDNAKLKLVRKLRDSRRQRQREGLVVLEGARLVLDGLAAGFSPELLVLSEAAAADASLRASLAANRDSVVRVPDALMNELCDTTTPQGVLAVLPQPSLPLPPAPSLVLVCDTVGDPGNLGTLLRSAAGAGADAALLLPGCVDVGPKALRAGMARSSGCRSPPRRRGPTRRASCAAGAARRSPPTRAAPSRTSSGTGRGPPRSSSARRRTASRTRSRPTPPSRRARSRSTPASRASTPASPAA